MNERLEAAVKFILSLLTRLPGAPFAAVRAEAQAFLDDLGRPL